MNRRVLLLGALVIPLAGCGDKASADEPPKITLGKSSCHRCGMIISEERHAAAIVPEKGDPMLFDDVGEMVATVQEIGLDSNRVWVHDMESTEWIDASQASFIVSDSISTPMGTGVVAFQGADRAESFSRDNDGIVYTWDRILSEWKINPRMS